MYLFVYQTNPSSGVAKRKKALKKAKKVAPAWVSMVSSGNIDNKIIKKNEMERKFHLFFDMAHGQNSEIRKTRRPIAPKPTIMERYWLWAL